MTNAAESFLLCHPWSYLVAEGQTQVIFDREFINHTHCPPDVVKMTVPG